MWIALLVRAALAGFCRLPGVYQLLAVRSRTRQAMHASDEAAKRADRLIRQYQQMDQIARQKR